MFDNLTTKLYDNGENKYKLVISPLFPGYGQTFGNSLRRIMLSSIPGFAITHIRINEITHEYQTINNVVEDALQVILNIKNIRAMIKTGAEKATLTLIANQEGDVFASQFAESGDAKILNSDLYICHINPGGKLKIEIDVERGIGYRSCDDLKMADNIDPFNMMIDAVFSPVYNVAMIVEDTRVSDKTNYNKLTLEFETDGSIDGLGVSEFCLQRFSDFATSSLANLTQSVEIEELVDLVAEENLKIQLEEKILKKLLKCEITTNSQLKEKDITYLENETTLSKTDRKIVMDYIDILNK
jgi:DNA-directed RNA polymerase subunit alpha